MERWVSRVHAFALVLACMVLVPACHIEIDDQRAHRVNDDAQAEQAVLRTVRSYYDALSSLDSTAFLAHFWPGADVTTRWQPPGTDSVRIQILPVEDFVRRWPEGPGSRAVFEERMLEAEVRLRGDLAQAWVHYAARFGDSSDVQEWRGIDAFTLIRHVGTWRIVELAFVPDP